MPVRREPGAKIRVFSGASGSVVRPTTNYAPVTKRKITAQPSVEHHRAGGDFRRRRLRGSRLPARLAGGDSTGGRRAASDERIERARCRLAHADSGRVSYADPARSKGTHRSIAHACSGATPMAVSDRRSKDFTTAAQELRPRHNPPCAATWSMVRTSARNPNLQATSRQHDLRLAGGHRLPLVTMVNECQR